MALGSTAFAPVVIGLGGNLGDVVAAFVQARAMLAPIVEGMVCAPLYRTPPLLPENPPPDWHLPYANTAIAGRTAYPPLALLERLQTIEYALGRRPSARWAPRVLDLDLLLYGTVCMASDRLTLPHPGLYTRAFALWPLDDVWPAWRCSQAPWRGYHARAIAVCQGLARPPAYGGMCYSQDSMCWV
jgi:2-amino-4-hydroxy-6-hydroxymethyldihydropteridine diphosphokinase